MTTVVSGPITVSDGLSVSGAGALAIATGGVTNAMLANAGLTLGSTALTLGATTTTIAGLTLTGPTLTTPALGTPASGVLTNATGLPVASGISGLGTGVATALAVNVGSAGAPVVNGGALGTPSSGTLTNATGLPIAGITGLATGVATALAAGVTGSGSIVLAASPTFSGTVSLSALAMSAANYVTLNDYAVASTGALVVSVMGSSGTLDTSLTSAIMVQKHSDSTGTTSATLNPAASFSMIRHGSGDSMKGTALYAEIDDVSGWSGTGGNSFSEAIRGNARLMAGTLLGSAYGGVFTALEAATATHTFLIGVEAEVQNTSTDAAFSDELTGAYSASYIATSDGGKKVNAAFAVNPHTADASQFIDGFRVPPSIPGTSIVSGAAFRSEAASAWGLYLADAPMTAGAIALPNNIGIHQNIAAKTATPSILGLDSSNTLNVGADSHVAVIQLGLSTVDTVIPGKVHLGSFSGPELYTGTGAATGTVAAGSIFIRTDGSTGSRIYVSAGGGTWNAIASV